MEMNASNLQKLEFELDRIGRDIGVGFAYNHSVMGRSSVIRTSLDKFRKPYMVDWSVVSNISDVVKAIIIDIQSLKHDVTIHADMIRLYTTPDYTPSLDIKNVIFNYPATIVYWADGTKTVVKVQNEKFDREKGLAMAIAKKALGNKGNYFDVFKKWTTVEEEKKES